MKTLKPSQLPRLNPSKAEALTIEDCRTDACGRMDQSLCVKNNVIIISTKALDTAHVSFAAQNNSTQPERLDRSHMFMTNTS